MAQNGARHFASEALRRNSNLNSEQTSWNFRESGQGKVDDHGRARLTKLMKAGCKWIRRKALYRRATPQCPSLRSHCQFFADTVHAQHLVPWILLCRKEKEVRDLNVAIRPGQASCRRIHIFRLTVSGSSAHQRSSKEKLPNLCYCARKLYSTVTHARRLLA